MRTAGSRRRSRSRGLALLLYDGSMVRRLFGFTLLLLVVVPSTALAYLDPGSSSLLFQAAAAALFTLLFVLRTWWSRIRGLFRKEEPAASVSPDASDSAPPPGKDS
jgi:hypothetical protein